MEFEKAIYRLYERCIEGIRDENHPNRSSRSCKICEYMTLWLLFFNFVILCTLHIVFVGNPGCLPMLIEQYNQTHPFQFQNDVILQINIDKSYIEDNVSMTDDTTEASTPPTGPSTGISTTSTKKQHFKHYYSSLTNNKMEGLFGFRHQLSTSLLFPFLQDSPISSRGDDSNTNNSIIDTNNDKYSNSTANTTTTNTTRSSNYTIYDYEFAYDAAVLSLSPELREKHQFTLINITMTGDVCFGNHPIIENMISFGGIDVVILNTVKYTMKHAGILATKHEDYYTWDENEFKPYSSVANYFGTKFSILFSSLFAFFAISTLTALLVRVLLSSGIVILFPIFWCLQLLGFEGLLNTHIIALSYPWLGIPMEILEASRQSTIPFIVGHLTRIVIFYLLYQSAQVYFSIIFYNRMFPGADELWLFALMMLWEYYSMLYVRALNSIRVFPRHCLFAFVMYHIYRYSYPTGFHSLALFVLFLFTCWSMSHCMQKYEILAFNRGDVTYDRPRALYNFLPWPRWTASLPPEYTVFQPISQRSVSVYQADVPPLHPTGNADPTTRQDNNNTPAGNNNNNPAAQTPAPTWTARVMSWRDQLLQGLSGSAAAGYRPLNGSAQSAPAMQQDPDTSTIDTESGVGGVDDGISTNNTRV